MGRRNVFGRFAGMVDDSTSLHRSPLHDRHAALGAKFAEFGGWSMPLEYPTGVVKEHTGVRSGIGVFDVSHLGKATVAGPGAAAFVNATLSNDLGRIAPGKAQYTLCCDDATGGIVDDLIAYYRSDDEVLVMPNAANADAVLSRLRAALPSGVEIRDHHHEQAVLAVQGAASDKLLGALGLPTGHEYMSFADADFGDSSVVVCRSGYTGEKGYELIVPSEAAGALWDALLEEGAAYDVLPCGLGARDTLRTEMGYPLHGQDITLDTTPNEARLGWAVGWKKPEFWGREVLLAERESGPRRRLVGVVATGRGIPRPHMSVSREADGPIGEITSGTFSPSLKKGVGLALLATPIEDGEEVAVDVRGRPVPFTVTRPPFVDTSVRGG